MSKKKGFSVTHPILSLRIALSNKKQLNVLPGTSVPGTWGVGAAPCLGTHCCSLASSTSWEMERFFHQVHCLLSMRGLLNTVTGEEKSQCLLLILQKENSRQVDTILHTNYKLRHVNPQLVGVLLLLPDI